MYVIKWTIVEVYTYLFEENLYHLLLFMQEIKLIFFSVWCSNIAHLQFNFFQLA